MDNPACAICVSMIAAKIPFVRVGIDFATVEMIPYYLSNNTVLRENNNLQRVRLKADTMVYGTYVCVHHVSEILNSGKKEIW